MKTRWFVLSSILFVACGDDSDPTSDAGGDVSSVCTSNAECDDGLFCNGSETCDPDAASSDSAGCVTGSPPCAECDEDADECTGCETSGDSDGDGAIATGCGGDDCDDTDPDRFPGNTETCDDGHDEDCDPTTLAGAEGDADGDGFVSALCCNGDACGDDCDDARISVNPGASEVCNLLDDDCNGTIDEDVLVTFYRDLDGDNFGDESMTTLDCSAPAGFALQPGDCDDANPARNPGNGENCDTPIDDNCDPDELVNEDCACSGSETRPCPGAMGVCASGIETCSGGTFGSCSITPAMEVCGDGLDQNCNGTTEDEIDVGVDDTLGPTGICSTLLYSPATLDGDDVCRLTGLPPSPFVRLALATELNETVGVYYDDPAELGYGPIAFQPNVSIQVPNNPMAMTRGGWAILMLDDPPGELLSDSPALAFSNSGAPRRRSGIAVEWVFEVPFVGSTDRINIVVLDGNPSTHTVIATCSLPSGYEIDAASPMTIDPGMRVEYRPANEHTRVTKRVQVSFEGVSRYSCSTTDSRLPDWSFGQELYVGITASNEATTGVGVSMSWRRDDGTSTLAPVELAGTCP